MKTCRTCKVEKDEEQFLEVKDRRNGNLYRFNVCRACEAERAACYRANNPDKVKAYSSSARGRLVGLRSRGVKATLEELIELLKSNRCAGCDLPVSGKGKHVDHCHRTGRLRGILCNNCNHALGHTKDSPVILRRLADYLELAERRDAKDIQDGQAKTG